MSDQTSNTCGPAQDQEELVRRFGNVDPTYCQSRSAPKFRSMQTSGPCVISRIIADDHYHEPSDNYPAPRVGFYSAEENELQDVLRRIEPVKTAGYRLRIPELVHYLCGCYDEIYIYAEGSSTMVALSDEYADEGDSLAPAFADWNPVWKTLEAIFGTDWEDKSTFVLYPAWSSEPILIRWRCCETFVLVTEEYVEVE